METQVKFAAVLPAGGLGKRMGGNIPKQLLPFRGKPVYRHSLETFLNIPEIAEVVLVVPEDWEPHFREELVCGCGIAEPLLQKIRIVVGGKERWESVRHGVNALSEAIQYVLVHDVARPFLSETLIREVFATLESKGACLVARPVADTVKVVERGAVTETLDRNKIWLAQTPQSCLVSVLKELYTQIDKAPLGFVPTDEASILEHFNVPVYVVKGEPNNDKITTPEDFARFTEHVKS